MKLVNGKWRSSSGDPINHFNSSEFERVRNTLSTMYGESIDYDKIEIVCYLTSSDESSRKISGFIEKEELFKA